ncbi:hypothetical protein Pcinc_018665 [Petrolisthes cinctipes]|uniref:Uncharacterized protein n=1 Tax=Petrolisthes cinctipes TaxID=88211 RepID=A0AAE1FN34_PETCI|nr:hypothetical protein Pcinc_018665 [Petrolisthes cinctipes]
MVQRSFTRQIRRLRDLSYWDRLMELGSTRSNEEGTGTGSSTCGLWTILEGQYWLPSGELQVCQLAWTCSCGRCQTNLRCWAILPEAGPLTTYQISRWPSKG